MSDFETVVGSQIPFYPNQEGRPYYRILNSLPGSETSFSYVGSLGKRQNPIGTL